MASSIVLVYNNPSIRRSIDTHLCDAGFDPRSFESAIEAVRCFGASGPLIACLITETTSFGISGWDLARIARQSNHRIAIVYLAAADADDWLVQGVPKSEILEPGWAPDHLPLAVGSALARVGAVSDGSAR